ncbi:MAG: methyltransferase domain-containing protein [Pseudomonadota bacterium]
MQTSPFDQLADDYDQSFTQSACGAALRAQVWERLPAVFGTPRHILELGCGTGEDAMRLARAGHRVTAIDVSPEMIRIARLKALSAGLERRIDFQVMPIEALHTLPPECRFDGVFSNFGAINCVADVPRMARTLAALLVERAPLLFVVMGRYVPWEWAWYLAHGEPARAFRRLREGGVEWRGVRIHYPTPAQFARAIEPHFRTRRRAALGFALPPSYAAHWLDRRPRTLSALTGIERATRRFTASLGDHFLIEAARAPAAT